MIPMMHAFLKNVSILPTLSDSVPHLCRLMAGMTDSKTPFAMLWVFKFNKTYHLVVTEVPDKGMKQVFSLQFYRDEKKMNDFEE